MADGGGSPRPLPAPRTAPVLRRSRRITAVPPDRREGLVRLCALDPVEGVSLAHQVTRWERWGRGDVVVTGTLDAPTAGAWATGSLMVYGLAPRPGLGHAGADPQDVRALAEHARGRMVRRGAVSGPRRDVEAVWGPLSEAGLTAREARWNQPLLLAPRTAEGLLAAQLRRRPHLGWVGAGTRAAVPAEDALVQPAAAAMFREEVGYDPACSGRAFARHISWLVGSGRGYVLLDDGQGGPAAPGGPAAVAFKADVGSLWRSPSGAVAQLTGVWTRPDLRGRGIGTVALAAVVDAVRADHVGPDGVVSLYANDFNAPALGLYRSLGFTRHGTFATILL